MDEARHTVPQENRRASFVYVVHGNLTEIKASLLQFATYTTASVGFALHSCFQIHPLQHLFFRPNTHELNRSL